MNNIICRIEKVKILAVVKFTIVFYRVHVFIYNYIAGFIRFLFSIVITLDYSHSSDNDLVFHLEA